MYLPNSFKLIKRIWLKSTCEKCLSSSGVIKRTSNILNIQECQRNGCLNTEMNGTAFFLPCHSGSIFFQIEIYNLDGTKSSFQLQIYIKK